MNRLNECILAFAALGILWYECRQDLAIFCYRIGCNALMLVHRQAQQLAPGSQAAAGKLARTNAECSIPSSTFSAPFTTLRDSKS